MSRYHIGKYAYGFDRPLSEYFLSKGDKTLVGILSQPKVYGGHVELMTALQKEGVWEQIPEQHRDAIAMDLPF